MPYSPAQPQYQLAFLKVANGLGEHSFMMLLNGRTQELGRSEFI